MSFLKNHQNIENKQKMLGQSIKSTTKHLILIFLISLFVEGFVFQKTHWRKAFVREAPIAACRIATRKILVWGYQISGTLIFKPKFKSTHSRDKAILGLFFPKRFWILPLLLCLLYICYFFFKGRKIKDFKPSKSKVVISGFMHNLKLFPQRIFGNLFLSPYTLSGIRIKKNAEFQHFLALGSTGSGKSTAFSDILRQIRARGDRAVIIDFMGDYVTNFYDKRSDSILMAGDVRSVGWSFKKEEMNAASIADLAAALIQSNDKGDPYWPNAAREIVECTLRTFVERGKDFSNKDIADILIDIPKLREFLKGTEASQHLAKEIKKQTSSIMSMVSPAIKFFREQAKNETDFSLRKWAKEGKGFLFLSTETISGEIGKVQLSAFFEILSSALVGLSDAERQRTFLMIDEAAGSSFLKGLVNLVANARRKKICIALAIQDIAFLEDSFGKGKAGVLQTNLCNHIYFQQNCGEAAEKIARISGTVSKEEVQETMQVGPSDLRGGESFSKVTKETLKIPASQIQNLKERQAFLKLYGFSQIAKIRFPKMRVPFANPKFVPGKIDKVCSEEKTENEDMKKTKETKPENKKTIKKESKTPMYGPLKTAAKKSVKPIEEKEGGEFV